MRREAMISNRISLLHLGIAEFLLAETPARFTCLAYDLGNDPSTVELILLDEARSPCDWARKVFSVANLQDQSIDIAGQGNAVRDVVYLLCAMGAMKDHDFISLREPDRPYHHTDHIRCTPAGKWLARHPAMIPSALRSGVMLIHLRPWTGAINFTFRLVLKPAIALLAAIGGLHAIRNWFGL